MSDPIRTPVFEAGMDGYRTCRIPGISASPNGVILATCEARRGRGGDWDEIDGLLRRSLDGGATWQPHRVFLRSSDHGEPGDAAPINNVVLVSDASRGLTHCVFCHRYARVFHMTSADDGASWSEAVDITAAAEPLRSRYPWHVIAAGPAHGIVLDNGRIVIPIWLSDGSGDEMGPGNLGHRPSAVSVLYSDDGATWATGDVVVEHGGSFFNPSETVPVQLSDGRVLFNIRTENPQYLRLISVSDDGVRGWSRPRWDEGLDCPICMASIHKPPGSNDIVFCNPASTEKTMAPRRHAFRDRKNLTLRISEDDCQSWAHARTLEPGPSGYSDMCSNRDGELLVLYECGLIDRMCQDRYCMLARLDPDWIRG